MAVLSRKHHGVNALVKDLSGTEQDTNVRGAQENSNKKI